MLVMTKADYSLKQSSVILTLLCYSMKCMDPKSLQMQTAQLSNSNSSGANNFWIPDLTFGYSLSSLHELMGTFGADGHRLYLGIAIWDSFVYSFYYSFILASSLQWSINFEHRKRCGHKNSSSTNINSLLSCPSLLNSNTSTAVWRQPKLCWTKIKFNAWDNS